MTNRINEIANEAIEAAVLECNASNAPLSTNAFDGEVECLMLTMSFENETTKNMVISLVGQAARKLHAGYFEASKSADAAYMTYLEDRCRKSIMSYLGASSNEDLLRMAKSF